MINDLQTIQAGLGFMRFNPNDIPNIQETVDIAYKNGIRYFESCMFYLNGQCEKIVGQVLSKYPRDSYLLADKICLDESMFSSPLILEEIFNNQLKLNNTNYFDIYLFQAIDKKRIEYFSKYPWLYSFFLKKKMEGKIKFLGFSYHDSPENLEQFITSYKWDCCQLSLNYFEWFLGTAKEAYSICEKYSIPIFCMNPLRGGNNIYQLPLELRKNYSQHDLLELSINFLQNLPAVKIILLGAENPSQIEETSKIFLNRKALTDLRVQEIIDLIQIYQSVSIIHCTQCGYCYLKCPKSINIPQLFKLYNALLLNPLDLSQQKEYNYLIRDEKNGPYACLNCGQCEKTCTQKLNIRNILHTQILERRW